MEDGVNQQENPEMQSGDGNLPGVEESGQGAVSEAGVGESNLATQKDEALAKASARLVELEQVVASKDGEMATLKQAKAELEEKLTTLNNYLAGAVASYRAMVVQTNPDVFEELIGGDTIEAVNESLRKAKTLVSKVRQGLEAEIASARVPVGAPERTPVNLSALSPREKIQYAIGSKK